MQSRIIAFVIGYGFGQIASGYLFGKAKNVDLRKEGSGNIGSTNTLRVLGNFFGVLTLICDISKTLLAVWLVWLLFRERAGESIHLLMLYAAFGSVVGHDFPAVMRFKGGKGIACSLGLVIACFPQALPLAAVIFLGTVFVTRFVSLGSILGVLSIPLQVMLFARLGVLMFYPQADVPEAVAISVLLAVLGISLHHANIGRLLSGTENRFAFHHGKGKN